MYSTHNEKKSVVAERFIKRTAKKTNQKDFRIEKVIKKNGNKLYAKWKGYNNSFNSWIDINVI